MSSRAASAASAVLSVVLRCFSNRRVCAGAPGLRQPLRRASRRQRQDLRGEQPRVGGAGLADGQRADGHAGRHLHDRQQAVLAATAPWTATGTPSTGSGVIEAVMPGRCAAPPAPAMITLSPRSLAPSWRRRTGAPGCDGRRRCGSRRRRLARPASRRRGCRVGQSDWLPMMMPTRAFAVLIFSLPSRREKKAGDYRRRPPVASGLWGLRRPASRSEQRQAMMSGSSWSSIAVSVLERSFRFFRRLTSN